MRNETDQSGGRGAFWLVFHMIGLLIIVKAIKL